MEDIEIKRIWCGMIQRCTNPMNYSYPRYGGRGIWFCSRWREFENFKEDILRLGPRPETYTLDRIDNNSGYHPLNVRWASRKTQTRNAHHFFKIGEEPIYPATPPNHPSIIDEELYSLM